VANSRLNSWIIGFAPFDHPRLAFAVVLESQSKNIGLGAQLVMREIFNWMIENTPEYFK